VTQTFDEPGETGGTRLNPRDCLNHLLMVWSIDYIAHSPTVHTRPDRPSDAVIVDVIDLDLQGEDGGPGLVARKTWWRQARLIQSLRDKVGNPRPMLVRMTQGIAAKGFQPPYELLSMSQDPQSVARARHWLESHRDFEPSKAGIAPTSPALPPQQPVNDPWASQPPRQETPLEQMIRQGVQPPAPAPWTPPPPPPYQDQPEKPPY
jgi:hypothetical protein